MNTRWYILFNFQTTFPLMNMLRYVNTATFNCLFPLMNPLWYMQSSSLKLLLQFDEHSATFKWLSRWQTHNEICILQFWNDFPFDEHMIIYKCCNFKMTFLLMNAWWYINTVSLNWLSPLMSTWWYIHAATLKWLSYCWTPDDMTILRLLNTFPI